MGTEHGLPEGLKGVVYRLFDTPDPEERLEDAAMWKAFHDIFGKGITLAKEGDVIPGDVLFLGRMGKNEGLIRGITPYRKPNLRYWEDPAFLANAGREFYLCDLEEAESRVAAIHAAGHDVFLKATMQKFYTAHIPKGVSLTQALDAWAFSFMDRGPCLMVQQFIPMCCERRYLIVDGEVMNLPHQSCRLEGVSTSPVIG